MQQAMKKAHDPKPSFELEAKPLDELLELRPYVPPAERGRLRMTPGLRTSRTFTDRRSPRNGNKSSMTALALCP